MADYKELLRRAVDALPENNGAARRAVYEKARAALVGQLRAINPPLPARDITTHRLQLEDCIRQVEQEASEAVIAGIGGHHEPARIEAPSPPPAEPEEPAAPEGDTDQPITMVPPKGLPGRGSIEDIIEAANAAAEAPAEAPRGGPPQRTAGKPVRLAASRPEPQPEPEDEPEPEGEPEPEDEPEATEDAAPPSEPEPKANERPVPSIVARAEAVKARSGATVLSGPPRRPQEATRRGPTLEPRREGPRLEPAARGGGGQAVARRQMPEPALFSEEPAVATAMSAVREVDVEVEQQAMDPQGAIDRAIATLDREARGESEPKLNGVEAQIDDEDEPPVARKGDTAPPAGLFKGGVRRDDDHAPRARSEDDGDRDRPGRRSRPERPARGKARRGREAMTTEAEFPRQRVEEERGGLSPITIFLVLFAVLLIGAGGTGYWAVSQGYLDLSSMFRSSEAEPVEAVATAEPAVPAEASEEAEPAEPAEAAVGPGNTATAETPSLSTPELDASERLTPEPALTGEPEAPAPVEDVKDEERLEPVEADDPADVEAAVAAVDPVNIAGSQSLLLEASDDGTTGAVPFSGTVNWSEGTDETGQPTLVGEANIPARNLGVDILIRKNADPSLPASHLMEINFRVSDGFIGGSVAGLPGVLLKNEELVQGTPLVGASARVVGNSFLFALSASPEDAAANGQLLTSRKWMDLAIIYATGKRAIITLEKDEEAQAMFEEVFTAWGATSETSAG